MFSCQWKIAALAVLVLMAGCRGEESGKTSSDGIPSRGTIGLSVMTLTNPFFKVIADTLTDEARKHGYEVLVTSGEFDVARQRNQVKDFIVRKVSAIVLCPTDSKSIGTAIQEANQAGIPVFTADLACLAPGANVVSHIATDNYAGGKEAGKAMIEALGEAGGKVVILHYEQAESCLLRVQGFTKTIDQYNRARREGRIDIVAVLPGGGVKDTGYKSAEDAIQAHPDLAGIFAINDPSALGARAAMEKASKADQVRIIGFDGQPEGRQAIKDGLIYADPIQFPDRIGRQTMQTIARHFEGEKVPEQILIPTALYRKADAEKDPTLQ